MALRWIVGSALLLTCSVSAQIVRHGQASPIAPEITLYDYPGVIIGVPLVVQQGQYLDTCNCPPFTGGSGSGIMAGVFYELPATEASVVRFGLSAGGDYRSAVARYREQEALTFTSADGNQSFRDIPVEFRQEMRFSTFALWAQPYVRVVPIPSEALAASVGANLAAVLTANATHTKSLVDNTVRLPNGEVVALQMPGGGTSATVRDGELLGLQRFQIAAVFRLESSIPLGEQWRLRPGLQYQLPLTDLSSSGGMRLAAWMLTLSLARRDKQ
ncbi:MAG: hypothetical protein KatS3mg040_0361 [Candidatus Kapaibacterium sp.]|nr:MAG: hypothetical protein KatS3mg040_0361 [Candidatus Kapabacteria bacterium]